MLLALSKRVLDQIYDNNKAKLCEIRIKLMGSDVMLNTVIDHPRGAEVFMRYLSAQHAGENLQFYIAVEKFDIACKQVCKQYNSIMRMKQEYLQHHSNTGAGSSTTTANTTQNNHNNTYNSNNSSSNIGEGSNRQVTVTVNASPKSQRSGSGGNSSNNTTIAAADANISTIILKPSPKHSTTTTMLPLHSESIATVSQIPELDTHNIPTTTTTSDLVLPYDTIPAGELTSREESEFHYHVGRHHNSSIGEGGDGIDMYEHSGFDLSVAEVSPRSVHLPASTVATITTTTNTGGVNSGSMHDNSGVQGSNNTGNYSSAHNVAVAVVHNSNDEASFKSTATTNRSFASYGSISASSRSSDSYKSEPFSALHQDSNTSDTTTAVVAAAVITTGITTTDSLINTQHHSSNVHSSYGNRSTIKRPALESICSESNIVSMLDSQDPDLDMVKQFSTKSKPVSTSLFTTQNKVAALIEEVSGSPVTACGTTTTTTTTTAAAVTNNNPNHSDNSSSPTGSSKVDDFIPSLQYYTDNLNTELYSPDNPMDCNRKHSIAYSMNNDDGNSMRSQNTIHTMEEPTIDHNSSSGQNNTSNTSSHKLPPPTTTTTTTSTTTTTKHSVEHKINKQLHKIVQDIIELREVARNIMQLYIHTNASEQLNLPEAIRVRTEQKFESWTTNLITYTTVVNNNSNNKYMYDTNIRSPTQESIYQSTLLHNNTTTTTTIPTTLPTTTVHGRVLLDRHEEMSETSNNDDSISQRDGSSSVRKMSEVKSYNEGFQSSKMFIQQYSSGGGSSSTAEVVQGLPTYSTGLASGSRGSRSDSNSGYSSGNSYVGHRTQSEDSTSTTTAAEVAGTSSSIHTSLLPAPIRIPELHSQQPMRNLLSSSSSTITPINNNTRFIQLRNTSMSDPPIPTTTIPVIETIDLTFTDLFQEPKAEILKLLRDDKFPRWKTTSDFHTFITSIKPYERERDSGNRDQNKEECVEKSSISSLER